MHLIYLDSNATTRPAPEVTAAIVEVLQRDWGNASSGHRFGQAARRALELARASVCRLLGCDDGELVLTSGGTESDNLALFGSLRGGAAGGGLVTSRAEHHAVRETAERLADDGVTVHWLDPDRTGRIDPARLGELLDARPGDIGLVSIMWVNNETGAVQPVAELGAVCRERGVRFHTDATQIVGKEPVNVAALPVDLLTFSAHKFHGPKGTGGLYVRRGTRLRKQMIGGPQERERRGGTENVAGAVGLGAAAEVARRWLATSERQRMRDLRDRFERGVLAAVPDAAVNAGDGERIWNTSNIAFANLEAEAVLLLLSERGVCASAGSACASGSIDPSPVLLAMGVPAELAMGSVRFSLSRDTTETEIDRAVEIVAEVVGKLRIGAVGMA